LLRAKASGLQRFACKNGERFLKCLGSQNSTDYGYTWETRFVILHVQIWGTVDSWWLVYGVELLLTVFITICMYFFPESPSFLLTKDQKEEAEKAIIFYHGVDEAETEPLMADMKKGVEGDKPSGLFEIFTDSLPRKGHRKCRGRII
ncbi:hypothetical protein COOONC_10216, partial [Cooperia oncophora]